MNDYESEAWVGINEVSTQLEVMKDTIVELGKRPE